MRERLRCFLLISFSIAAVMNLMTANIPVSAAKPPEIFAHRGTPTSAPEHSYQGYNAAIKSDVYDIEQDVHLSLDHHLFVSHDNNLKRTTGTNLTISQSTSKQLSSVRLKNGEHLHQLKDVLRHYQSNKKVKFVIEAKHDSNGPKSCYLNKRILQNIHYYHLTKRVILQDQKLAGLKYTYTKSPKITLLWLLPDEKCTSNADKIIKAAPPYVRILSLNLENATKSMVRKIHASGHQVNLYTIDSVKDEMTALDLQVDSFFSNDAPTSKRLLKNKVR